ncbi:MAG: hypothetical protein Q8O79_03710 [Pseudomonadota bacterium]|nr:hypothetical protein [Pseudomonadota bacterium]
MGPALAEVLETITPEELGYSKIKHESIGPTRAEMRRIIADKQSQVAALIEHEGEIVYQLQELGINVSDVQAEAA